MKLAGAEAEFDPAVLLEAAAVDDVGNEKGPAVFPPVAAEATDAGAEVPKTNPPDEIAPPAPDAAAAFTASGLAQDGAAAGTLSDVGADAGAAAPPGSGDSQDTHFDLPFSF